MGVIPGLVWLLYFRLKRGTEKGFFSRIVRVFLLGCICTVPTAIIGQLTGASLVQETVVRSVVVSFLLVAPLEEFFKLAANITRADTTLILTSEIQSQHDGLGVFDIEAFLASGVIVLYNEMISETSRSRSIEVLKLRGSKHSSRIHSMRITDEGIRVWPAEISTG